MFDTSRYTIGWICAITPELVAAKVHLDVEHDAAEYMAPPKDNNTYVFGSIGKHNIVIAALPLGEYGTSNAATVAQNLIRSFTNLRIGLMVGIGGGAPLVEQDEKKKQDIRLGDVVVSTPGNGRGGVCQYDYHKAVQGQGSLLTGHLNSPPTSLLAAITALRTDFEINGHNIDEDVSAVLARRPRLQKAYRRPAAVTDRLYKCSFVHSDCTQSCSKTCNIPEQIVERATRHEEDENVAIHYGLIASANTLMKDALLRDSLARKIGVLCFEMEAAGLMNELSFLVIRGICDYSDSHKNKDWQGYAAMTAAAYARKLLLRLAPNKVGAELRLSELKDITEGLQHVSSKVDSIETQIDQQSTRASQQDIERWLAAPDQSTNHNNALQLRHEGSGSWVPESDAFRGWQKAEFPLIWVRGISGSGKTILTSTIIEHLRCIKDTDTLVLYFYFDIQDRQKQTLDQVLRALIRQLCYIQYTSRSDVEQLYEDCDGGLSQPSTTQLSQCLVRMYKDRSTTIVLDALDECTERDKVLSWIKDTSHLSQTRLVVTSRLEDDIQTALKEWIPLAAILEVDGDLLDEDIRAYVRFRIYHGTDGLQRWRSDPRIQQHMEMMLMQQANGMFRWVACQLDALRQCLKPQHLREALRSLPEGLYETYARVLRQISSIHLPDAIRLLQFLVFSERPLQLEEAVDALAVDENGAPTFDVRDRMPVPHEIARYCASLTQITTRLASVDKRRRPRIERRTVTVIQLAHPSVREYFRSNRLDETFKEYFRESRAKACIVQVSLAYLYQASQGQHELVDEMELPFIRFAARCWMDHAPSAEKEGKLVLDWIYKLLTSEDFRACWLQYYDPDDFVHRYPYRSLRRLRITPSALYYASMGGLPLSAQRLLAIGADVDAEGGRWSNALNAASLMGHTEVVKVLLDAGASVNTIPRAVVNASIADHTEVVELLLATSAKADAALLIASREGLTRVVKVLLDGGAIAHADPQTLYDASVEGHTEVVKLLLDGGAIANAHPQTLYDASVKGHTEVVKLLLAHGANANSKKSRQGQALQKHALFAASKRGHMKMAELLLDGGAVVDSYPLALHIASERGHSEVVKLLLARGADANARQSRSGTALQTASYHGRTKVVKLLLEVDVDINAIEGESGNALHAASYHGYTRIVELLLNKGADVNVNGGIYGNALQAASCNGHTGIVELLLNKDADVNVNIGHDGNALQAASCNGHMRIVELLLNKGADVNANGGHYGNALQAASYNGHTRIVELLLNNGADLNGQGFHSGNALYRALARGHTETVNLLRARGATSWKRSLDQDE